VNNEVKNLRPPPATVIVEVNSPEASITMDQGTRSKTVDLTLCSYSGSDTAKMEIADKGHTNLTTVPFNCPFKFNFPDTKSGSCECEGSFSCSFGERGWWICSGFKFDCKSNNCIKISREAPEEWNADGTGTIFVVVSPKDRTKPLIVEASSVWIPPPAKVIINLDHPGASIATDQGWFSRTFFGSSDQWSKMVGSTLCSYSGSGTSTMQVVHSAIPPSTTVPFSCPLKFNFPNTESGDCDCEGLFTCVLKQRAWICSGFKFECGNNHCIKIRGGPPGVWNATAKGTSYVTVLPFNPSNPAIKPALVSEWSPPPVKVIVKVDNPGASITTDKGTWSTYSTPTDLGSWSITEGSALCSYSITDLSATMQMTSTAIAQYTLSTTIPFSCPFKFSFPNAKSGSCECVGSFTCALGHQGSHGWICSGFKFECGNNHCIEIKGGHVEAWNAIAMGNNYVTVLPVDPTDPNTRPVNPNDRVVYRGSVGTVTEYRWPGSRSWGSLTATTRMRDGQLLNEGY